MSNDTPGRHAKQLDRVALRERRRLERVQRARPVDDFTQAAMAGAVAAGALARHEYNKRRASFGGGL